MYFLIKVLVTAVVIAAVSELAKRSLPLAAILASLPLTSILAMLWLYRDTGNELLVVDLSQQIFWALLPSLLFFVLLPWMIRWGLRFELAICGAMIIMVFGYLLYAWVISRFGINL
ncbi:DUF3147 family protein [Desulfuromonas sp. TF]|jgi:hypothetical protein|uniref:DUF3147 family protein n=1 Tax=Desulfuromonas sp. TF TaxID=1232410 RepID=UPI000418BDF9|nr:DUF3147 family protein [Desulfuromonas sp. TF]